MNRSSNDMVSNMISQSLWLSQICELHKIMEYNSVRHVTHVASELFTVSLATAEMYEHDPMT